MAEDHSERRRRKRRKAFLGDVVEAMLDNGRFRYLQYCADSKHAPIIRVLAGTHSHPLKIERLAVAVAGDDESVSLCFLDDFVTGEGIEIVANLPIPENRRGPMPVIFVWMPEDPDLGWISDPDGASSLIGDFVREHPDVDIARVPHSGIGHPFRMKDGRLWEDVDDDESEPSPHAPLAPIPLDSPQQALLELYRNRAQGLIRRWQQTFSFDRTHMIMKELMQLDHEDQKAVAITVFLPDAWIPDGHLGLRSSSEERSAWLNSSSAVHFIRQMVLTELTRRRLVWSAEDLELLCAVAGMPRHPDELNFVIAVLRQYFVKHPRDNQVVDALGLLLVRIDHPEWNKLVGIGALKTLLAAQMPPGQIDRSIFDTSDAFGVPACSFVSGLARDWPSAAEATVHFASARGSKPSKAWRDACAQFGVEKQFNDLVEGLCRLITTIDLTDAGLPRERLLSGTNEFMARGAVWAIPFAQGEWRIPLLGQIALRCGAKPSTVTGVICSSVSLAAIDSISAIGSPSADAELDQLLSEVANAGLLRKVAKETDASQERLASELRRLRTQRRSDVERPWLGRWH